MSKPQKSRKLTKKERKELLVKSVERVRPYLLALEKWRMDSLNSNFRF